MSAPDEDEQELGSQASSEEVLAIRSKLMEAIPQSVIGTCGAHVLLLDIYTVPSHVWLTTSCFSSFAS